MSNKEKELEKIEKTEKTEKNKEKETKVETDKEINGEVNKEKEIVAKNDIKSEIKTFLVYIIIAILSVTLTYSIMKSKYEDKTQQVTSNKRIQQGEISENATAEEGYNSLLMNIKQLRQIIDSDFVGEINEKEIVEQAIKGYVNGLQDDYSEYYTTEEWATYKEDLDGEFCGIGIYLTQNKDKNTVVVSTIEGTPAEEAGLKSDDIIYKVDGEEVLGLDLEIVSKKVKGPEGSKVKLTLARDGKEIEKEITRKKITVINVHSKMLEDNIGYIQIESFDSHVSTDFKKQYKELTDKGMKKLILDLRNNTGGDVNETIRILDVFLPKKSIVFYTKDSKNNEHVERTSDDEETNIPIIILGNKYSASASEIVISALIDNKKATFIGEKTYGKGVIQTVFETSTKSALKLTTLEYFRPNKEKIHKIGIKPDIEVKIDETKKDSKGVVIDAQLNRAITELNK